MPSRIVEIASENQHLSLHRGFMCVSHQKAEVGRIPLSDIAALLCNAHGLTYSNNLLLALSERGTIITLCGPNHLPSAWVWPLDHHHIQTKRMRFQLDAPKPLKKRLWQKVVQAKISQQQAALNYLGQPSSAFDLLIRQVKSGDPTNIEAQAARRYWPLVFGGDFRRTRNAPGINGMLNYGYTVLRATVARAVISTGLHPSLGLHHHNQSNPMCLIDDLMEPFRPLVDLTVFKLVANDCEDVCPDSKKVLVELMSSDMASTAGTTPLFECLERLAFSLFRSFETGKIEIELPLSQLPLELAQHAKQPRAAKSC